MRSSSLISLFLLSLLVVCGPAAMGDEFVWPAIPPEQIAMKDHPLAAGAHAMILDWEVFADDSRGRETTFVRLKIFSDEGREHGNISIPFFKGYGDIKDLVGRTVQPDGRVVPLTGGVFEKTIAKTKQIRYLAKTFSFSEVQAGSILEYYYTRPSARTYTWSPQGDIPILHLDFKIRPSSLWLGFRYVGLGLPAGKNLVKNKDGTFELIMDNVAALEAESYAPPEYELKPVIWLFYTLRVDEAADAMWKRLAKESAEEAEPLLAPSSLIRDTALATVNPSDSAETKLRKLYARVQQVRNLGFEREKTYEEYRREKLKDNNKTQDVLKHGYGSGLEINRLYIAMVRSLGLEANEVFISQRNSYFFHQDMPAEWQLNSEVVEVRAGDKTWYVDPVEKFCPFGLLPWQEAGVVGLRITKEGGTFITTPNPTSDQAVTDRKVHLRWEDGDLNGEATIQFKGQDALLERLIRRDEDAAVRSKETEDEIKKILPPGSTVKVKQVDGLDGSEEPVTVTFDLHIPNQGVATGKRLGLPLGIFATQIESAFRFEKRKYALYFAYPYQEFDEITLDTPEGYVLDRLPEPRKEMTSVGRYVSGWDKTPSGVKFTRRFALDWFYFQDSEYPAVRKFYYATVDGDQNGVLFQTHAPAK